MSGGWETSRRRELLPPDWSTVIRPAVLARDDHTCQLRYPSCQAKATDVDHMGDRTDHRLAMLQAACKRCHATKSAGEGGGAWAARRKQGRRPPEAHPGLT